MELKPPFTDDKCGRSATPFLAGLLALRLLLPLPNFRAPGKKEEEKRMKSIWKWVALLLLFAAPYVYSNESLVIENIECEGNGSTDCALIKETIFLSPGDEVEDEELHNARTRLGLMGLFKT